MMRHPITSWLALIALCLALLGCSDEPAAAPEADKTPETPKAAEYVEVLIEVGSPKYFPASEQRTATDVLRGLVEAIAVEGVQIDPEFDRPGQLQLIVKPIDQTDKVYADLKTQFDQAAREAVQSELSAQQGFVKTQAEAFQKYQQLMKQFQQGLAVEVEVNGTKLDRRKLDRLMETTLESQIEANKRIEALQRQIDRDRYATLLRLK